MGRPRLQHPLARVGTEAGLGQASLNHSVTMAKMKNRPCQAGSEKTLACARSVAWSGPGKGCPGWVAFTPVNARTKNGDRPDWDRF